MYPPDLIVMRCRDLLYLSAANRRLEILSCSKPFIILSSLGLSRSSSFPPWITAIPRWGSEGVNFYRQAVTEPGKEPEVFEELALLKDSFLLAAGHAQELLREEAIPPEELGDQTSILQAMIIAVNNLNTSRLRKLAGYASFDSK